MSTRRKGRPQKAKPKAIELEPEIKIDVSKLEIDLKNTRWSHKEKFNLEALDCICPPDFPICCCNKKAKVKILTRKPIQAGHKECKNNSRSHSAKLRAVEKI